MIINKNDLYKLLLQILHADEPKRKELINKFQNFIWKDKIVGIDDDEMDIYNTLAYDLDFYEPNEEWRKEDEAYYDENRLITEIKQALEKLKNIEN